MGDQEPMRQMGRENLLDYDLLRGKGSVWPTGHPDRPNLHTTTKPDGEGFRSHPESGCDLKLWSWPTNRPLLLWSSFVPQPSVLLAQLPQHTCRGEVII